MEFKTKDILAAIIIVGYFVLCFCDINTPTLDVTIPALVGYYFGSNKLKR